MSCKLQLTVFKLLFLASDPDSPPLFSVFLSQNHILHQVAPLPRTNLRCKTMVPIAVVLLLIAPCIFRVGLARTGSADPPIAAYSEAATASLCPRHQTLLAEKFAPTLVFHAHEEFFPSSPLFPLENGAVGPSSRNGSIDLRQLGTTETRTQLYRSMSLPEKERLAKLHYRAFSLRQGSSELVVLEYWMYYVQNDYRVRGGLFPFWVDASHPNDLEYIRLLLRSSSEGRHADSCAQLRNGDRIAAIISSVHGDHIPDHSYRVSAGGELSIPLRFLVELGAHASSLDVNQDGVFTSGIDAESRYKLIWGIRDRGLTWPGHDPSYMDSREEGTSIVLQPMGQSDSSGGNGSSTQVDTLTYRLVAVSKLESQLGHLGPDGEALREVFQERVAWPKRLFGRSNGNPAQLLLPPPASSLVGSVEGERFGSTERGFSAGVTTLAAHPAGFVGGRYAFFNRSKFLPDLILLGEMIHCIESEIYFSSAILGFYPIDAATKLVFGRGLVVEAAERHRRQWDWIAGLEIRLGAVRLHSVYRTLGPVTDSAFDLRLFYLF